MKYSSFLHTLYTFFFITILVMSTTLVHATAGVPDIISYQGRLTDQNGILLGGTGTTYHFKFSIWDAATVGSGTRLWPASAPTATSLTVTDGVFDVNIGDTSAGYPDALTYDFQSNDTVYLQVEVSPDGSTYETLGPRSRITSSSTAINAKTLGGLPSSYFLDATNLTNFNSRSLATPLTGYVSGAGTITASDTILSAIQKLNGNMGGGGAITSVFGRTGVVTAQSGDYTTAQVTESGNLYYTDARFDTRFGVKTTTNLTEGSNLYYTDARARAAISVAGAPLSYNSSTGVLSIAQATTSTAGYLSSADWNTFNNKQAAITTGTTAQYVRGDLSLATFPTALSSFTNDSGYLTTNQSITLSGDISGSGTTAITTTIGAGKVTNTMLAGSIAASKLVGTDIATVGTITSGVWNGTAIANANLANSSVTINGTAVSLGASGTVTAAAGTLTGTTLNSTVVSSSLTSVGTIGTGIWQGTVINPTYGGTGVNNGSSTITIAGNLVTTGAFSTTFAASASNTYTLPTDTSTLLANNVGISGGSTIVGDSASGGNLTLSSTSNATKGSILFGGSSYNESVNTLGIGTTASTTNKVTLADTVLAGSGSLAGALLNMTQTWNTTGIVSAIKLNVTNTASNATSMLLQLQTGGNNAFRVFASTGQLIMGTNAGNIGIGPAALSGGAADITGSGIRYVASASATTASYSHWFSNGIVKTSASGVNGFMRLTESFSPTSGTAEYNMLTLFPTINQTGVTGSPITRGLYINPTLTAASDFRAIETASADFGNGAAGLVVMIGRNTNATATGAGSINFLSKAGTNGYVWQDAAGNMRINTAAPTNANDTAGTVIGAQTSTRNTKQDIADYTEYADALQKIVDAPLHTFRYIKEVEGYGTNSPLAKTRIGFIADEVDPAFMVGNVIDQVSINGLLMASIKELNINMQALPVLTDTSLTSKIADFLRGIAESGTALVENLKTKKVQTQELCIGDDSDQVCVTKDQLRTLIQQGGSTQSSGGNTTPVEPSVDTTPSVDPAPDATPVETTPVESTPVVDTTPTPNQAPDTVSVPSTDSTPTQ
jgi:hypothetical protein